MQKKRSVQVIKIFLLLLSSAAIYSISLQEVHAKDGDLTFKCDLCDKAFLTQGLLSSHKGHHLKVSKATQFFLIKVGQQR